jgi:mono/diheme cytochrome c family protein
LAPIGPKIRNLNIPVERGANTVNQLAYFQNIGLLNQFDVNAHATVPDYHDESLPLEQRARAYLDINCAHCHNEKGTSSYENMFYAYDLPFEETNIEQRKEDIVRNLVEGSMPQIGTSVIDEEGVALIEAYINSL